MTVEDGGDAPATTSTAAATQTPSTEPTSVPTTEPTSTASAPALPKACTRMGCIGALEVAVVGGDKLAKGKYVIDVEADGKKGKCTFAAPSFCEDKAPKCEGDIEIDVVTLGCPSVTTGPAPSIKSFKLPSSPAAANITVTRDGKKVGEVKLAPQYKEVRPNGPDCDPVCKNASEKLEIK